MDTEHFKQKLEEELVLLEKQLNELGWKNPQTGEWDATGNRLDVSTPMADSNEAADQLEDYGERQAEVFTLEARRIDVKDALDNMKEGKYGICEIGKEKIEEDRLEANPAARTCKLHMI